MYARGSRFDCLEIANRLSLIIDSFPMYAFPYRIVGLAVYKKIKHVFHI